MKLSDLKTGMIVTLRNGEEYVVFKNFADLFTESQAIICNTQIKRWMNISDFSDDMKCTSQFLRNNYDIVKVEIPHHPYSFGDIGYAREKRKLLWKEEAVKEVTMAEIEEKFGCKVKIIKED